MTENKKPKIGQFTLTYIDNGWLVRWDIFVPDLQMTVPHIRHNKTLDECFELIKTMDPDRPELKVEIATSMPTVGEPKKPLKAH